MVGHGFVKCPFIAIRPYVELEALELDADLVRNVVESKGGEIRLPGLGAQAGNFGISI